MGGRCRDSGQATALTEYSNPCEAQRARNTKISLEFPESAGRECEFEHEKSISIAGQFLILPKADLDPRLEKQPDVITAEQCSPILETGQTFQFTEHDGFNETRRSIPKFPLEKMADYIASRSGWKFYHQSGTVAKTVRRDHIIQQLEYFPAAYYCFVKPTLGAEWEKQRIKDLLRSGAGQDDELIRFYRELVNINSAAEVMAEARELRVRGEIMFKTLPSKEEYTQNNDQKPYASDVSENIMDAELLRRPVISPGGRFRKSIDSREGAIRLIKRNHPKDGMEVWPSMANPSNHLKRRGIRVKYGGEEAEVSIRARRMALKRTEDDSSSKDPSHLEKEQTEPDEPLS